MPIRGLTDRGETFQCIGHIRKGEKKADDAKAPGKDLDYFRVEFNEGEEEAAALFVEKYGEEPKQIEVMLPFNEIERCWDAWYEAYRASSLIARADGKFYVFKRDPEDQNKILVRDGKDVNTGAVVPFNRDDVVGTWERKKGKGVEQVPIRCEPVGRLSVIVPALGRASYLMLHTTSINDIINISSQLEGIKLLNGGEIRGIPILLKRVPEMVSTPSTGGKRARRLKHLVHLEASPRWMANRLQRLNAEVMPMIPDAPMPQIEGGDRDDVPYIDVEAFDVEEPPKTDPPSKDPKAKVIRFTSVMLENMVKKNLAPDYKAASEWLEQSNLKHPVTEEMMERWLKAFGNGLDQYDGVEKRAIDYANKAYASYIKNNPSE